MSSHRHFPFTSSDAPLTFLGDSDSFTPFRLSCFSREYSELLSDFTQSRQGAKGAGEAVRIRWVRLDGWLPALTQGRSTG